MPTATAGQSFTVFLKQNNTTTRTALFSGAKWVNGLAPTITTTLSATDILTFVSDGTNWYGTIVQNFS
jgi:hypothetical protein